MKKAKKPKRKIPLVEWFVWMLRRATLKWGPRYKAMNAAKTGPNLYKCAICQQEFKKKRVGRRSSISADHIVPIKDPSKPGQFQDDFANCQCGVCTTIRATFVEPEGWQMLCMTCHDIKTATETGIRKEARKEKQDETA